MDKLVSVIVPVYKTEQYLDKCVASIVGQTYSNLEILLVDDGSPDNCPAKCDCWAEKDSRIKVIHKKNGGLSSARNAGIAIAQGDYLSFVDSDDWVVCDLYERVIAIFDEHDPDLVTFDCNRVNENGEVYGTKEKITEGYLTPEKALAELLQGNINNYAWNKVYKEHLFSDIRFPEGRVWEDMAIAYKLFLNCKKIYCYPVALYNYFTRSNSISRTIGEKALGDIFLARYECHMAMQKSCPTAQKYSFPLAALAARRLYDRSLWKSVDQDILGLARKFLEDNQERVLNDCKDRKYWLYYKCPDLYASVRIWRHKLGSIIKRFR